MLRRNNLLVLTFAVLATSAVTGTHAQSLEDRATTSAIEKRDRCFFVLDHRMMRSHKPGLDCMAACEKLDASQTPEISEQLRDECETNYTTVMGSLNEKHKALMANYYEEFHQRQEAIRNRQTPQ
mgnify:FL=1